MFTICIIFFLFITLFSISSKSKNDTVLLIWATTLLYIPFLSLLVGLNRTSPDIGAYLRYFINSPTVLSKDFWEYTKETHSEIGYDTLAGIVKIFTNSATTFLVLFCFISLVLRYNFYKKFISIQDFAIVFFGFLAHEFIRKDCIQIRNGFASAIVLYSLISLYKKKRLKFVCYVFFACCFQATAIVALPLVIAQREYTKKYYYFLVFLFVFALFISVVFPIKKIFYILSNAGLLPIRVNEYLFWDQYSRSMSIAHPILLKQVVITLFFFISQKRILKRESDVFFFFQIYLVCTVYYLFFRDFEILAGRFGSLFYGVEPVLLILTANYYNRQIFLRKLIIYCMYIGLFGLNIITNNVLPFSLA